MRLTTYCTYLAYVIVIFLLVTPRINLKEAGVENGNNPDSNNQKNSPEIKNKQVKNILVFSFPGGKSHIFIFRELFKYTKRRIAKEQPDVELNFYVLVHNFDRNIWEDSDYKVFGYGDVKSYEEQFFKAMENAKEDPVLGYDNFNKAMIHLYHDFMKDGILEKLKNLDVTFDMLITDVTNYVSPMLIKEFDIKNSMYMNPTCIFTWTEEVIEYNSSYHPLIGTLFTEKMNFYERFFNQLFLIGTRIFYSMFKGQQSSVFKNYGVNYELNPYPKNSIYLNQCVEGIHYPVSKPQNVISTGAILPKPSQPLTQEYLNSFLNKY